MEKKYLCIMTRCMAISFCVLVGSCSKPPVNPMPDTLVKKPAGLGMQLNGDTVSAVVTIDYESGTENSGIANLTTTHATADSSEYVVSPGWTGDYAIAHKVVIGDSGYFPDNHWRSEAASAQMFTDGKCYNGDERRI